jgi:hypothetical protein
MAALRQIDALHKFESNRYFFAEFAVSTAGIFTKFGQHLLTLRAPLCACLHCYTRVER